MCDLIIVLSEQITQYVDTHVPGLLMLTGSCGRSKYAQVASHIVGGKDAPSRVPVAGTQT